VIAGHTDVEMRFSPARFSGCRPFELCQRFRELLPPPQFHTRFVMPGCGGDIFIRGGSGQGNLSGRLSEIPEHPEHVPLHPS
jgi:hypothetical protein